MKFIAVEQNYNQCIKKAQNIADEKACAKKHIVSRRIVITVI
jgi:hypothetical protein